MAAICVLAAVLASGATCVRSASAAIDEPISGAIAAPWPGLQLRSGAFRDYVADGAPGMRYGA